MSKFATRLQDVLVLCFSFLFFKYCLLNGLDLATFAGREKARSGLKLSVIFQLCDTDFLRLEKCQFLSDKFGHRFHFLAQVFTKFLLRIEASRGC